METGGQPPPPDDARIDQTQAPPPAQTGDEGRVIHIRLKRPRARWLVLGLVGVSLTIAALLPATPGLAQETMVRWGHNSYVLIRGHSEMASPLAKIVELGNEVKSKEATIAAQNEERERLLSQLHATEDIVNKLGSQLRATEDLVNERTSALTSTQSSLRSTQSQLGTTQSQLGTTQSRLSETQTQLERNARLIQAYDNLHGAWNVLGINLNLMIDASLDMWDAARTGQWALANYYVGEFNRLVGIHNRLATDYNAKLQALRTLF